MNRFFSIIAIAALAAFTLPTFAQEVEIPIANGSSSGTYKMFFDQIVATTGGTLKFKEVESHGAVENLDLLINNKVAMAFMHSDVIFFRSQRDPLQQYKTLIALFKEEVHFIALTTPKRGGQPATSRKEGGTFGFGGKTITTPAVPPPAINTFEDLKPQGKIVGAAGGGFVTAQVVKSLTNSNYEVVQFAKGDEVLTALAAGQVDAVVFVGGAPIPNVEKLDANYKILPIGDQALRALSQIYTPATVTYTKMSPEGIPTVAADALLVAREYKSPRMVEMLGKFRETFYAKLLDLQETPGLHPKWQEVSKDNKGKWAFMELAPTK